MLMKKLLSISDQYSNWTPSADALGGDVELVARPSYLATLAEISATDLVIVTEVGTSDVGLQLGGAVAQALEESPVAVVFAFPVAPTAGQHRALERLGLGVGYSNGGGSAKAMQVLDLAFESYFRRYGVSNVGWFDDGEAEFSGLARIPTTTGRGDAFAALRVRIGRGELFVVPYHVANFHASHDELLAAIRDAVEASQSATTVVVPEYLAELRLGHEPELREEIATLEAELATRQERADELARFRMMLGPLQGDGLEDLVVEALTHVLEPSDVTVENGPENFAEDFWLMREGARVALVEVKGVNSGVKRAYINQVDNHREDLGLDTTELGGLLILNLHRSDQDLVRKTGETIHPTIVAQLCRQNVLLLRTADLWFLLHRSMLGQRVDRDLLQALGAGGGWLEVTAERADLRQE